LGKTGPIPHGPRLQTGEMKYYSEEEMKDVRLAFEKKILTWPYITTKKMFGCPCYQADGRLFAFLVTRGIVLTQLSEADRETVSKQYRTAPFQVGKKTVHDWLSVPVDDKRDLDRLLPFVRKSYRSSLSKTE
jgi:hypothetical protein